MGPEAQISDGLSITLSQMAPKDDWAAVAVVTTKVDQRHRITFTKERTMEDVFCKEIASVLRPIIDGFGDRNQIYSSPDTEVRLPGLLLRQLRVIFSKHDDGRNWVLVRFATFVGNPYRALLDQDGFSNPLEELTTQVYRDALDWVLMPALSEAEFLALDSDADGQGHSRGQRCTGITDCNRTEGHTDSQTFRDVVQSDGHHQ